MTKTGNRWYQFFVFSIDALGELGIMHTMENLITVSQAARAIGVSYSVVRDAISDGKLIAQKQLGWGKGIWLITPESLAAYIQWRQKGKLLEESAEMKIYVPLSVRGQLRKLAKDAKLSRPAYIAQVLVAHVAASGTPQEAA